MNLKIAHIGDLKGMCFNIPDYQRGYRWETKQIRELLDDLLEFALQKESDRQKNQDGQSGGAFYCLQPLVVVENNQNLVSGQKVFDVIDGQQRLTTMFLIINYIKRKPPYRIRYDRACNKEQSICFENGEISYDKLKNLLDKEIENNPDLFYLSKAIIDIQTWFEQQEAYYDGIDRIIEDIIQGRYFKTPEQPFYEDDSDTDVNEGQSDVRFIWYDATDASIDYQGSISVFKRLNYGKTSLTAAELIKALLFQCDVYESSQKAERKQVAFRMSTEWDRMEKALQNKFLWSMLAPENKNKISNIDFLLSYVATHLVATNNLDITANPADKDYDYIVFDRYIKHKLNELDYAHIVEELWRRIQDVFDVIISWYNDRQLYHLIGLHLTLLNPKNKERPANYNKVLREMFEQFEQMTLQEFKDEQRRQIGNIISLNHENQESGEYKKLTDLAYGSNDEDLIKILLVYNVTLCMKNGQDNQYFPFWFYQDTIPSLEHIHPQHLHDEDIDFDKRCDWYSQKRKELDELSYKDENQRAEIENARDILDKVLLVKPTVDPDGIDSTAVKELIKKRKEEYEANEIEYKKALQKIDELFDELADIKPLELHCISNMALVDKDTNAALGNGLMMTKRQKLMERQDRFNNSEGKEGAYTFAGTWRVFNKQFLDVNTGSDGVTKASNLLFWSKNDRNNYLADIENIYSEYTK